MEKAKMEGFELNTIVCGDYIKLMNQLSDNSVDLIITDPPYDFVSKNPKGGGFMKKENKKHLVEINNSFGMSFNPATFLEEAKRVLKKMNMYVFCNKKLLFKYLKFIEDNNYSFDVLVWVKPNPVPINNGHYLIDKEYIIYVREKGACFNSGLGYNDYFTYFIHPIGVKLFGHPTVKPLSIVKNLVKVSSGEGDIILDPFLGSGTTGVACKQLGRNFMGFEISPEYCEIARKRLEQGNIKEWF